MQPDTLTEEEINKRRAAVESAYREIKHRFRTLINFQIDQLKQNIPIKKPHAYRMQTVMVEETREDIEGYLKACSNIGCEDLLKNLASNPTQERDEKQSYEEMLMDSHKIVKGIEVEPYVGLRIMTPAKGTHMAKTYEAICDIVREATKFGERLKGIKGEPKAAQKLADDYKTATQSLPRFTDEQEVAFIESHAKKGRSVS